MGPLIRWKTVACLTAASALAVVGFAVADSPSSRRSASPAGQIAHAPRVTDAADRVAGSLRAAGLPVTVTMRFTPANDPDHLLGMPGGCASKVAFVDPRINGGAVPDPDPGSVAIGGVIEVYPNPGMAAKRAAQLQTAGRSVPVMAERDYLAGPVLIRLSMYLHRKQARQYQSVLRATRVPTPAPSPQVVTA